VPRQTRFDARGTVHRMIIQGLEICNYFGIIRDEQ